MSVESMSKAFPGGVVIRWSADFADITYGLRVSASRERDQLDVIFDGVWISALVEFVGATALADEFDDWCGEIAAVVARRDA